MEYFQTDDDIIVQLMTNDLEHIASIHQLFVDYGDEPRFFALLQIANPGINIADMPPPAQQQIDIQCHIINLQTNSQLLPADDASYTYCVMHDSYECALSQSIMEIDLGSSYDYPVSPDYQPTSPVPGDICVPVPSTSSAPDFLTPTCSSTQAKKSPRGAILRRSTRSKRGNVEIPPPVVFEPLNKVVIRSGPSGGVKPASYVPAKSRTIISSVQIINQAFTDLRRLEPVSIRTINGSTIFIFNYRVPPVKNVVSRTVDGYTYCMVIRPNTKKKAAEQKLKRSIDFMYRSKNPTSRDRGDKRVIFVPAGISQEELSDDTDDEGDHPPSRRFDPTDY